VAEIVDKWLGSKNAHPATPTGITRQLMIEDFAALIRAERRAERERTKSAAACWSSECCARPR
jgi:hypothetical protein